MTFPGNLLLNAAAGYFKGRNIARDRQYAEDQDTQARNDKIAERESADAERQQMMAMTAAKDKALAERQRTQDEDERAKVQRDNYNQGFDSTAAVQRQGQQVLGATDPSQRTGLNPAMEGLSDSIRGAATQAMQQEPAFTMGGTGYSKNHASVSEIALAAAEKLQLDKERALAADRNAAATQQQNFQHNENELTRKNARDVKAIPSPNGATPRQPTQGELAAGGLLPEIRGARDYLNKYDNPGALQTLAGKGGIFTNWANSPEGQAYNQAANQYIQNTIYAKSGKAVTEGEMKRLHDTYIPMPGDKPEVLARKREARTLNEQGVGIVAGRALDRVDALPGAGSNPNKATPVVDPRIAAYKAEGYSDAEIAAHLAKKPRP